LFSGMQNRHKISQAKIETETLNSRLSEVQIQIDLQVNISQKNLETSVKLEESIKSALNSSREYYKVVSKQYAQGQKTLLDLLDARNQLTNSQINYTVSHFETLIKLVDLERANASYDLNSLNNQKK
jgi:outer membrane protein TolC